MTVVYTLVAVWLLSNAILVGWLIQLDRTYQREQQHR